MRWWPFRRGSMLPCVPSGPLSDLEPIPDDWVDLTQLILQQWLADPLDPAAAFRLGSLCECLGHRDDEMDYLDPVLVLVLVIRAIEPDIAPDDARKLHKLMDAL